MPHNRSQSSIQPQTLFSVGQELEQMLLICVWPSKHQSSYYYYDDDYYYYYDDDEEYYYDSIRNQAGTNEAV